MNETIMPLLNDIEEQEHSIFDKLPLAARNWLESLHWKERRYVLSLCHLMCAASSEIQAEFLDNYTANGLVAKRLEHEDTQMRVKNYFIKFKINTDISDDLLRAYIRQFYIHSAQEMSRKPNHYLESALRLVLSNEERNNVFNYILGFELLKMLFKMSWSQHERLYQLQSNQEFFFNNYIKPIQHTHAVNNIIVPEYRMIFFAKRDYYVKKPDIKEKKLVELVMATFTTNLVIDLGFSVIRNPHYLSFDYDFIFQNEKSVLPLQPKSF